MELRRPCKMMSTDQWERRIPVSWSSSAFWLVEPAAGHKNAHQHEWAAILHYLGPFAAYFAPYPPTATFYNQPLYCTNNDSAVKSPKNRDHRRNLSKFWLSAMKSQISSPELAKFNNYWLYENIWCKECLEFQLVEFIHVDCRPIPP